MVFRYVPDPQALHAAKEYTLLMETQAILFEVDDHVATITLDRPDSLNAFDDTMAREMAWAWSTVRDDDDIHVAVLQANGERAFSTGLDVRSDTGWFLKDNVWNSTDPGATLGPKLHHKVWKPVVAAVHGLCAGGGQYFVNEADIVICSDDAVFFDPHANVGIVSAVEPIGMLWRGVPLGDVLRWALMGTEERITAETALRLGLGHRGRRAIRPADQGTRHRRQRRRPQPEGDPGHGPGGVGGPRHGPHRRHHQRDGLHPHRQHPSVGPVDAAGEAPDRAALVPWP